MRHPRDMGSREVEAFLTMLATELLARLLYGTGMRLMEGIHLRVKRRSERRPRIGQSREAAGRPRASVSTALLC